MGRKVSSCDESPGDDDGFDRQESHMTGFQPTGSKIARRMATAPTAESTEGPAERQGTEPRQEVTRREFEHWWVDVYPTLRALARALASSGDQAEEIVQEVAFLAWRRLESSSFTDQQHFNN